MVSTQNEIQISWLREVAGLNQASVKMVLIAYHLHKSTIGAYIGQLVNELMMTANKIEYKDAYFVMLPQMQ